MEALNVTYQHFLRTILVLKIAGYVEIEYLCFKFSEYVKESFPDYVFVENCSFVV